MPGPGQGRHARACVRPGQLERKEHSLSWLVEHLTGALKDLQSFDTKTEFINAFGLVWCLRLIALPDSLGCRG